MWAEGGRSEGGGIRAAAAAGNRAALYIYLYKITAECKQNNKN